MSLRTLLILTVSALLACSSADAQVAEHPAGHVHELAPPAALPGESLYQLPVVLDAADGRHAELASLAGTPVVIAMFYTSCTAICPMLTLQMQRVELALDPATRPRVKFVLISLDAERDSPSKLAEYAAAHHLDPSRWLIAHAAPPDVRALAAALGVRYRQLPDGSFSHSALITLLDSSGVPVARTQALTGDDPAFSAALRALLQ